MSSIGISYLERACLLGRAMNPDLVLPLCIQGWSIPAGPHYRALYAEIRDDNLITIPFNDEGEPDDMQIYPVALFESSALDKVIREAQLRSTGRLCYNCSQTPPLPSTSDQPILIDAVPSGSPAHSDSDIVIDIISPTPSPPPAGLPTTHGLQSPQNPLNHEFRHTLPSPPDATQSNIPIIDVMTPSLPSMASTSAAPIEVPAIPNTRSHSLASNPRAQFSTPASHHTLLSPAPSSPYGGSPKPPEPESKKRTSRPPKYHTTSSSQDEKKKTTETSRRNMAKSKGKAKASRRTGLNLSAAQLARRQEIKTLAMAIVTTKNSPVNRDIAKLALHQKVADDIVLLPPKHWMNLIAVKTNRAPAQVDNWFRNRQQRIDPEKASDIFGYTDHTLPSGEMAKMARAALSRAQTRNFSWTDEQFERVLDEWWSNISDFYPELRERGRTIPHYSSRV